MEWLEDYLADPDGDGIYCGTKTGLGSDYEYVYAGTGEGDGWSGWGTSNDSNFPNGDASGLECSINGGTSFGFTVVVGENTTVCNGWNSCGCDGFTTTDPMDGKTLIWSDEFEGTSLDSTKWTHRVWGPYYYNNEEQSYTSSTNNSYVSNGTLKIAAIHDGNGYTSARLVSSGKGDFLYGYFEARARVPDGLGTWPAIWMLPTNNTYGVWPNSGEIDIMEHVGYDNNVFRNCSYVPQSYARYANGGSIGYLQQLLTFISMLKWTADKLILC